jgi:16S rRNA (cytosine967-C5)-methyltransferase
VPSPARRHALAVLAEIARGRGTLAEALAAPAVAALDERERGLVHELVLGVLRRRGWLDHLLAPLVSRPLPKIAPGVLDALRLGAYQLHFTRVPAHAALSESVELARSAEPRAAGFANAVLRRLQREGAPPEPEAAADPLHWLTTYGSLPSWLAQRWCAHLGAVKAVRRARAFLDPPALHFRTNPRVANADELLADAGIHAEPGFVPGSRTLLEGRLTPFLESGTAYAQDIGSQLVGWLASCDGTVLDACAAPGGKSLLVADLGQGRTRVIAAEASPRRLRTLERLRARWGATQVCVVAADARRPPFARPFDAVLLDTPCSGLGTIARHPDVRWRCGAGEPVRQARRQRELIEALAPLVRVGGRLVYATCSLEPEENEGVVRPFLDSHGEFAIDELPDWLAPHAHGGFVRLEPGKGRGDAFFAARLRRR